MADVVHLASHAEHNFSKVAREQIELIAGHGVVGDAHAGVTVRHLSRIAKTPDAPNLRQVHLIHHELLVELAARGFAVRPGDMGENITTRGVDLLGLSRGSHLRIGGAVELSVTGLRNPCAQLDRFQPGLMKAVLDRKPDGSLIRKAGIMAIVLRGGHIRNGDAIHVTAPERFEPMDAV